MDKVTAEEYQQNPGRYELVSGHEEGEQYEYRADGWLVDLFKNDRTVKF